jgi:DNA helicase-2/ATP-dependent DNA helicase PcrA
MPRASTNRPRQKPAAQAGLFADEQSAFDRALAQLNPMQRVAVETIEGPVMCIAGPGTGKTQVVAMRVANILRKTQMRPGNILCLTFSTSGATAMRERLRSLIGADAYGVEVSTIHGFCNGVIQRNPQVFEEWSMLEQVSDIERYRIVNAIIDRYIEDLKIINRKSPYQRTKAILDRISLMKREGKSIDDLRRAAADFELEISQKSGKDTKTHGRNMLQARKFHDLVKIHEAYQEALKSSQRYDYEDMVLTVVEALRDSDWLLSGLQERYQYILVDEFQDTNGSQYALIDLLTRLPGLTGDPNIFIVGDDDQAIYRFQGATLHNILAFRQRFPTCPLIVLDVSYRCSQPILDAAGSLISRNTERLVGKIHGLRKELHASSPNATPTIVPTLIYAATDEIEPWLIADIIEDVQKTGIPYSSISVLIQKNSELPLYYDVLRSKGIPVDLTGKIDLLAHGAVMQLLCLLKAVANPYDSAKLAKALSIESFGIRSADLGRLFAFRREAAQTLLEVIHDLDAGKREIASLPLSDPKVILTALELIEGLHQRLESTSLLTTVERLLRGSGLLRENVQGQDPVDLIALQGFFHWIERRCLEQPSVTIDILLADLAAYENPDYPELRLTYAFPHIVEGGVRLMTAHQSKGLEFDAVILANFREGHWNARRAPSSIAIPEHILFGTTGDQKDFEQDQDERRVCYVAMTRARKHLIFTCPKVLSSGQKAREVSPSAFFAESGKLCETTRALKEANKCSRLLSVPPRKVDQEFAVYLHERLSNFTLSASALNHFLKDPKYFLEVDLLQLPEEQKPSLLYGNAVHAALALWGSSVREGLPLGLDAFIKEFEEYVMRREVFSEGERIGLLSAGRESLQRYYRLRMTADLPIVRNVEQMVLGHLDDIPLKGHIDRIDLLHPDGEQVVVVDYKTGRVKSPAAIRPGEPAEAIVDPDADYYRQLVFYALLMELGEPLLKPTKYILDFIGDPEEDPVQREFVITQKEKDLLRDVIKRVWAKVQNLDFTPLSLSGSLREG